VPPNLRFLLIPILPNWPDLPAGQLIGVSSDLDEIDQARELAESLHRTDCMFIQGSMEAIPWRDSYFDVAYLAGSASDEVRRVMTPEGIIHECQSTS
jgi:ubiquinone/menaquinone biosynthesis C-methylase UbiE